MSEYDPMFDPRALQYRQIRFDPIKVGNTFLQSRRIWKNVEPTAMDEYGMIARETHRLEAYVLQRELETREVIVQLRVPRTWIDHFFKWLGRSYRTKTMAQRVRMVVKAWYPEANRVVEYVGRPVVFNELVVDDMVRIHP